MRWWEVQCTVPSESVEGISALLMEWPEVQGVAVEGRTEDQPLHPEWGEWFDESLLKTDTMVVSFYVPEWVEERAIRDRIAVDYTAVRNAGLALPSIESSVRIGTVDETDWENAWKAHYQPISIGKTLAIVPTWERDSFSDPHRRVLYLEPGMAFGTGTHATTQLCMEVIETLPLSGKVVLDVGCGTGVLAMTAALCGADHVTAVDIDPVAVSAAQVNVGLNAMDELVTVTEGNLLDGWTGGQFDVAVANILRDAVILLMPQVWNQLKPGGLFLSSGYVETQAERVEAELVRTGFTDVRWFMKEDWVVLMAVKGA